MTGAITALCTRTLMIGGGNHFEVLVPLSDIDPEGQTYQVVRSSEGNKPYVLFVTGIEPYTTEIIKMPQGFDRYDVFKVHEKAAKLKEIALLRQAFPESTIDETSTVLWNDETLPSGEVRLKITPDGLIAPTRVLRQRLKPAAQP
jgi:hypothetical protein